MMLLSRLKLKPRSLIEFAKSLRSLTNVSSSKVQSEVNLSDSITPSSEPENLVHQPAPWDRVGEATDLETAKIVQQDFKVYENFITEAEEKSLLDEVEPYLKRLKYEVDHWDDAIHGFRETERKVWSQKNRSVIERVKNIAFPPGTSHLSFVHVLDLLPTGVIKAHVDSIKFCGDTIAGMSLLSSGVMRFVNVKDSKCYADMLISRRSLYIMKGRVRYDYTHEVLEGKNSMFRGNPVEKERRIAVICRNEPVEVDVEQ